MVGNFKIENNCVVLKMSFSLCVEIPLNIQTKKTIIFVAPHLIVKIKKGDRKWLEILSRRNRKYQERISSRFFLSITFLKY